MLSFYFGAEGEIRTLAAVTHPTPLAGAPRHQLEYFCKTVTLTHTVKLLHLIGALMSTTNFNNR